MNEKILCDLLEKYSKKSEKNRSKCRGEKDYSIFTVSSISSFSVYVGQSKAKQRDRHYDTCMRDAKSARR